MESIAQRLRRVRAASGLGTKVLSEACGLSGSHVRMIENGNVARPDLRTLEKIAATTGVPVAWLAFGAGECPADSVIRETCAKHASAGDDDGDDPIAERGAA